MSNHTSLVLCAVFAGSLSCLAPCRLARILTSHQISAYFHLCLDPALVQISFGLCLFPNAITKFITKSKLDHGHKHSTCKPIAVHQLQDSHLDRLDYRPNFPTLAEQGQIKCQLRNRLRGGLETMTSLPESFPFCHGVRKHGKSKSELVSTDLSFEFQEVFNVSTHCGYRSKYSVVVSFSDPRTSGGPFCWRIHYTKSDRNSSASSFA
ncbi:hypothetical protein IW262DRAFT_984592 [Armillaria fumosa]|nr:hypothetical protein IW262DRAFT_984592 [Armillaria fumosa]